MHLRLEASAERPGEALTALAAKVERLRGVLADRGVDDDAVESEHLEVHPGWDDGHARRPSPPVAATTVRVGIPSLAEVGPLLDAALDAVGEGASVQQVVQVPVTTPEAEGRARAAAVEAARAQAAQLAEAAGGAIGGLLSLLEGGPSAPAPFYALAPNSGAVYRPTPHLWQAQAQVHVTVTAVYEIVESDRPAGHN